MTTDNLLLIKPDQALLNSVVQAFHPEQLFQVMTQPETIAYFVMGACIGSFLNVVIYRFPNNLSVIRPPSSCPKCQSSIKPWQNIPVLSYLFLKGKCFNCKTDISWRYPLIELKTAFLFAVVAISHGFGLNALFALILVSLCVVTFWIDIDQLVMMDLITGLITIAGFSSICFNNGINVASMYLLSGLAGALGFWLINALTKVVTGLDGIGTGDMLFAIAMGCWLGPVGLVAALILSTLIGAATGGVMLLLKWLKAGQQGVLKRVYMGSIVFAMLTVLPPLLRQVNLPIWQYLTIAVGVPLAGILWGRLYENRHLETPEVIRLPFGPSLVTSLLFVSFLQPYLVGNTP
jgi:leader peptidase (prepilin peptidase) / N-methyltransferase